MERLDRQANAALIVSGVSRALGSDVEVVDPGKMRADFDAALRADPVALDDKAVLLEALGLRSYRGGVDR